MGHGHGHSHTSGPLVLPDHEARRVRFVLAAVIVPLVLAAVVGMVVLWPRGEGSRSARGPSPPRGRAWRPPR